MTLTTYEYIWKVTYESLDDGHRLVDSYWSDTEKARNRAEKVNKGNVNQTELVRDNAGNYYKYQLTEVTVDPVSKAQVLSKLTPKERKALGF